MIADRDAAVRHAAATARLCADLLASHVLPELRTIGDRQLVELVRTAVAALLDVRDAAEQRTRQVIR